MFCPDCMSSAPLPQPLHSAWCSLCPPHALLQPLRPEIPSKHTLDGVALLLKTPRFSHNSEQNFCPSLGSKPCYLVLQMFAAKCHTAPCSLTLIPQTGSSLSPQGLCMCFSYLECSSLSPFCLIILVYHFALTFTSLCREPDLLDHSGPLVISLLGTVSLFMTSPSAAELYIDFVITCSISVSINSCLL